MELRLAVEVEAAALAAERANRRQVGVIRTAWRAIDRALQGGEGAVAEDFAFHRAIAEATGNRQFPLFLAFLGSHVIPRQSVRLSVDTPAERRAYLERIQHEHARNVSLGSSTWRRLCASGDPPVTKGASNAPEP